MQYAVYEFHELLRNHQDDVKIKAILDNYSWSGKQSARDKAYRPHQAWTFNSFIIPTFLMGIMENILLFDGIICNI